VTAVTICKVSGKRGKAAFRAKAGEKESTGATLGEALDALTASFGEEINEAAVLIHTLQPDEYFRADQQRRMKELFTRPEYLSAPERSELESLIDTELDATVARTSSIAPGS
jgi:hypothetical protein